MIMIQERYCSFEVNELLREKGFDEPCRSYFINDLGDYRRCTVEITNRDCSSEQILRPTHQMAMDWLREVHNILIWFSPVIPTPKPKDETVFYWEWEAKKKSHSHPHVQSHIKYKTYEEAVESALKYSLENLI